MKDNLALLVKDKPAVGSLELTERRSPASPPTHPSSRAADFSLLNLSIKRRLPLFIGLLLSGMLAVSTWAAYRGMKETALEAGRERLRLLTQQLASMFQQSFTNVSNRTATAANDAAIREYLLAPGTPPPRGNACDLAAIYRTARHQQPASRTVERQSHTRSSLARKLNANGGRP